MRPADTPNVCVAITRGSALKRSLLSARTAVSWPDAGQQRLHRWGVPVVAALAVLAIGSAALAARAALRSDKAEVTTTRLVSASDGLLVDLLSAETGGRGYLLTGHATYLSTYRAAIASVPGRQKQLASQVAGLPAGPKNMALPDGLVTTKLGVLARTVGLAESDDHAAALSLINEDVGKRAMDSTRNVIAKLQQEAHTQGRHKRSALVAQIAVTLSVMGGLLVAILTLSILLRRAHRTAHIRDEDFRRIFDESPVGMGLVALSADTQGCFCYLNERLAQMAGRG